MRVNITFEVTLLNQLCHIVAIALVHGIKNKQQKKQAVDHFYI